MKQNVFLSSCEKPKSFVSKLSAFPHSDKKTEPLTWIKENLIFLPVSGPKLKGKLVGEHILPFQEDIIKAALTPEGDPNKNIFMGYSRKISKSLIFSWIFNYLLENKEGMSLVNMASTFTQSNIIFRLIVDQVRLNPRIDSDHYQTTIEFLKNKERHNQLYKVFSKASSNLGMLNVSALIADEVGAMQSRENLNSIMSGLAMAQTKPLLLFSSNPPEQISHWSNEYIKTLKGDPDWTFFDYSADLKEDVYSEKAKAQANPFYSEYLKTKNPHLKSVYDFVNKEAERAKKSSENLVVYRRFQLGQRISAKAYQWVDVNDIKIAPESVLKNKELRPILAFDLALSNDFCACLLCFFNESTEDIYLYPFLHLANTDNRSPSQKTRLENWSVQNYITIQNRPAIDKNIFIADIKTFLQEKGIIPEAHVWDRNLSQGWTEEFGGEPELYKGTAYELAHAIRFVEARSKEGKLHFIGENPCLKWMFDNPVCSQKSKGYVLLDRVTWRDSIDGAVCCVLGTKYFIEHRRQTFYGFHV